MTTTTLAYIPSPSQGVWHLGPLPIRAYALFIIVGIVVALVIGDRRWEARGGERGVIYDIMLWAVPFGLIGGRLYHVFTDWPKYFGEGGAGLIGVLRIWDGGLGIWGAVALGGVGAWIGCRQRGIPLPAFGDAVAPGIVLAQAIGRLGNYFNQELYGHATTLPWGLEIYYRRDASGTVSPDLANGVSTGQLHSIVHPTFLYELLWNVLVFAMLIWVDRRFKIGHGRLFALYVAGYCVGRFWIELMRSDLATHIAGIRINSFTSVFVFVGAVVYFMVAPKGREDPSELRGRPEEAEEPEELVKELAAVASTTGVVAAAKVAGEMEDEDAEAAEAEAETEEPEEPAAGEPEAEEPEAEEPEAEEPEAEAAEEPAEPEAEAASEDEAAEESEPEPAEPAGADVESEPAAEPVEEKAAAEPDDAADDVELSEPEAIEPAEGLGAEEAAAVADQLAAEADEEPEPQAKEGAEPEPDSEPAAAEQETEGEPAPAEPEAEVAPEATDEADKPVAVDEAEEADAIAKPEAEVPEPEPESGGRVSRWLRNRRSR